MIELRGINKAYGELEVLKDINLKVEDHEIMTIVGPSGAGKTTLLQIAGTLDRPDSGSVCYGDTEIPRDCAINRDNYQGASDRDVPLPGR